MTFAFFAWNLIRPAKDPDKVKTNSKNKIRKKSVIGFVFFPFFVNLRRFGRSRRYGWIRREISFLTRLTGALETLCEPVS